MTHPPRVPGVGVDPEAGGPACLLARPCPGACSTHSRSARDDDGSEPRAERRWPHQAGRPARHCNRDEEFGRVMTVGRRKLAGVSRRLRDSSQAFATVQRNPTLRRALLAFGFAWTAEWAFTVALGVVAFRNGGATAVGVVAFARMAPA